MGPERGLLFIGSSRVLQGVFVGIFEMVGGSFSNLVSFKVGDGSHICFFHDVWSKKWL
jgi:hypothetical protein